MASLLGPQWLCECNASGGAKDVAEAKEKAAQHFLEHPDAPMANRAVSVYRERNDWVYTISIVDEALDLAFPLKEVNADAGSTTLTVSYPLPPGATIQLDTGIGTPQTYTYTLSEPMGRVPKTYRPPQGIELGSLPLEQASAQFNAMVDQIRAETFRRIQPGI